MSIGVGIDFGTTNSCIAISHDGHIDIISNEMGNPTAPSYISITDSTSLIGESAKYNIDIPSSNIIFDLKQLIGQEFSNPTVQHLLKRLPFTVLRTPTNHLEIQIPYHDSFKHFSPESLSALILSKLKLIAEPQLTDDITEMILTVPISFNNSQRLALQNAAQIAGLNVYGIIKESIAAAIAFGFNDTDESYVFVFDFGGRTLKVAMLEAGCGLFDHLGIDVSSFGGEDITDRLVDYFADRFQLRFDCDLRQSSQSLRKLRIDCERVKITLSTEITASINICYQDYNLKDTISRRTFQNLIDDLFRKILIPIVKVLQKARITKNKISGIIMVGGSSNIPRVQQLVREFFDGKEPCKGIDPDKVVAYGAARLAGGIKHNYGFSDFGFGITPLSIGIETVGEIMTVIVSRCSTIPARKSRMFTTYCDNQSSVLIKVYHGERASTRWGIPRGSFELTGIPPAPRGIPQIEVTFDLNYDETIHVSAEEKSTGNRKMIVIDSRKKGFFIRKDFDRMPDVALRFQTEDEELRKEVKFRLQQEQLASDFKPEMSKSLVLIEEEEKAKPQVFKSTVNQITPVGYEKEEEGRQVYKSTVNRVTRPRIEEVD
jgi:L1 cell adhesion molecule like protein